MLRGAWALETLAWHAGASSAAQRAPARPGQEAEADLSVRQKLEQHRADPVLRRLPQADGPDRVRAGEFRLDGALAREGIERTAARYHGRTALGRKFKGPVELRQALLNHKDDFLRHLTGKVLGYALGRSLQDGDSCTVQHLVDDLAKDGYRARTLIREVVLSVPFRNTQGGVVLTTSSSPPPPKRQRVMVTK